MQRCAKYLIGCSCKSDSALAERGILTVYDTALVVEAVERRAEIENVSCDNRGLVVRKRRINALGEQGECLGKLNLKLVKSGVGHSLACLACLLKNGAGTGVGVLSVGTCITVEGQRVLHNKVDVTHTVVGEVVARSRCGDQA